MSEGNIFWVFGAIHKLYGIYEMMNLIDDELIDDTLINDASIYGDWIDDDSSDENLIDDQ